MSVKDFDAACLKLQNEIDQKRDELRRLRKERDLEIIKQDALDKVANLNDDERAALVQAIETSGIETKAKLGKPGNK